MIYLASPIKHADPAVVRLRVSVATRYAGLLFQRGEPVFCPAAHGHAFASLHPETDNGWGYWRSIDIPVLSRCCDELVVLTIPGWAMSQGVTDEIAVAAALGIAIRYVLPDMTREEAEVLDGAIE